MQAMCNSVMNGTPLGDDIQKKLQAYMPSGGGSGSSVPSFGGFAPAVPSSGPSSGGGGNADLKAQLLAMG